MELYTSLYIVTLLKKSYNTLDFFGLHPIAPCPHHQKLLFTPLSFPFHIIGSKSRKVLRNIHQSINQSLYFCSNDTRKKFDLMKKV